MRRMKSFDKGAWKGRERKERSRTRGARSRKIEQTFKHNISFKAEEEKIVAARKMQ
jgi:hypothetical protein